MASDPKKVRSEPPQWFTYRKFPSDVTLKFDDGQELYVAKEFLAYSSPVFEAMFTHEMKEKREGSVELKGKSYTDFHQLLMAMHPRDRKPLEESTVLPLLELSLEYQISALVRVCKHNISQWMRQTSKGRLADEEKVNVFLKIIKTAWNCNQEDIVNETSVHLSKFKFDIIEGDSLSLLRNDVQKENENLFRHLDVAVKSNIYRCRLSEIDD